MKKTLNIIGLQFDLAWEDPEANKQTVEAYLQSQNESFDLVVLPEMFTTGFSMEAQKLAEKHPGPTVNWLHGIAKRYDCGVVASLIAEENDAYFNRLYFIAPDGVETIYNKKHLFSFAKEDTIYTAGENRVILEFRNWKIMPLVCYDLRFPVWSRNNLNYDIAIYIANWPTARSHHWKQLLRARAIENLAYVVGINRIGIDGYGNEYTGDSAMVDFSGHTLDEKIGGAGFVRATFDPDALEAYRRTFRFLQDGDDFVLTN